MIRNFAKMNTNRLRGMLCIEALFLLFHSTSFAQCNDFYITGTAASSACKEAVENVVWVTASSNVRHTIIGNSLNKTSSNGNWDGNGFSYQSVSNNGYMQTTIAETNRDRMIGLSATDVNGSFILPTG